MVIKIFFRNAVDIVNSDLEKLKLAMGLALLFSAIRFVFTKYTSPFAAHYVISIFDFFMLPFGKYIFWSTIVFVMSIVYVFYRSKCIHTIIDKSIYFLLSAAFTIAIYVKLTACLLTINAGGGKLFAGELVELCVFWISFIAIRLFLNSLATPAT